jgi:hypothetical protein
MITTLMMLLGLSGAGAGLYNVIKNPSEGDGSSGESSPSRRKRARGGDPKGMPREEASPGRKAKSPAPEWGGRGEEVPFHTPKAEAGKSPRGDARPLTDALPTFEDEEVNLPEDRPSKKQARKNRKSKENEEPPSLSDLPLGDFGNDEVQEQPASKSPRPKREQPDISFSADDIISKNSKFSFHRRPLLNAEALIEKNNLEEAIEIFQRTGDRIPDPEIKNKIQQNISELEDFIEEEEASQKEAPKPSPSKDGPISDKPKSKPGLDKQLFGDSPPSGDGYQDFVSAMKQVADVFADSIAKAIQYAKSNTFPEQASDGSLPKDSSPRLPEMQTLPSGQGQIPSLPPQGKVGADFLHPLIYQFLKDAPPLPGYAGLDTKEEKQNYESLIKSLNQGLLSPPNNGIPGMPQSGAGLPGIVGPFYLPSPDQLQTDFNSLSESLNKATDSAKSLADLALEIEKAKSEVKNKEISDLDLPEDTFFSEEWKEFRGLPLVDRRIGGERRKNSDRRDNKANRKDRRSGSDRRKVDRFKEREEYLKNKALEKLEEAAKQAQALKPASLNDLLKPYFPPAPERLNLPEGYDHRPKEEPLKEEPKPEEWIEGDSDQEWFDRTSQALRKEVSLPEPVDPKAPTFDFPLIGLPDAIDPTRAKSETIIETDDPIQVELMARAQEESLKIGLPSAEESFRDRIVKKEEEEEEEPDLDEEPPEIELIDGELGEIAEAKDTPDEMANKIEEEPEKIIHGVLELKPPEADDAPFLTLTYDFGKIPHAFRLSKNYSIMEYSYYKYKPMLMKAQEFARRKMLKNALNYYRVIKSQNIPPELRKMINRNIRDITEFMEKFLMAKGG